MSGFIHPTARLEDGVTLGENCVVEAGVHIGACTVLGHGVILRRDSVVGANCRLDDYVVVGKEPLCSPHSAVTHPREFPPAQIGDRCLLGTGAIVYRGGSVEEEVLLADGAVVREESRVGAGSIIGRLATVENQVWVGRRCKVQTGAYLCAYSHLEDECFIGPMVTTTNDRYMARGTARFAAYKGPLLARGARLGAGTITLPGVELGEEAAAAAGSIVTHSIPPGELHLGIPAKFHRPVPAEERLEK